MPPDREHPLYRNSHAWHLPQPTKVRITLLDENDTELAWQELPIPSTSSEATFTIPTRLILS